MNIAIFSDTFLPEINGVTKTLSRFGDYLESHNINYLFITPNQVGSDEVPYNCIHFFSTPLIFYPECRFSIPNNIRLATVLKDFKPDIIHLMTEFNLGFAGLQYAKKNHIPVISNYSTNFDTIFAQYHFQILSKPLKKYLSWFHSEANLTVTPSNDSKEVLHNMGVDHVKLFQRGIDTSKFSPALRDDDLRRKLGLTNRIALLYVGRISAEKDLHLLAAMMEDLNPLYKERITLVLAGDGPMKAELEERLPSNTVFTGFVSGRDLSRLYASCDIFVFPSSFETFGNVVLEAFASGLPVIGVNEGAVRELIDHEKDGLIAKAHDSESFSSAVESLIENDLLRYQYGFKARKKALNYSWDAVFEILLDYYKDLVNRKKAQAGHIA